MRLILILILMLFLNVITILAENLFFSGTVTTDSKYSELFSQKVVTVKLVKGYIPTYEVPDTFPGEVNKSYTFEQNSSDIKLKYWILATAGDYEGYICGKEKGKGPCKPFNYKYNDKNQRYEVYLDAIRLIKTGGVFAYKILKNEAIDAISTKATVLALSVKSKEINLKLAEKILLSATTNILGQTQFGEQPEKEILQIRQEIIDNYDSDLALGEVLTDENFIDIFNSVEFKELQARTPESNTFQGNVLTQKFYQLEGFPIIPGSIYEVCFTFSTGEKCEKVSGQNKKELKMNFLRKICQSEVPCYLNRKSHDFWIVQQKIHRNL